MKAAIAAMTGALLVGAPGAFGADGADALLNAVGADLPPASSRTTLPEARRKSAQAAPLREAMPEPTHPLAEKLLDAFRSVRRIDGDYAIWVRKFLVGDHEGYAHLYGALMPKAPEAMEAEAEAAQVYSLAQLGLRQPALDRWTHLLTRPSFRKSDAAGALEDAFGPQVETWVVDEGLQLDPRFAQFAVREAPGIAELKDSSLARAARASTGLRAGADALKLLGELPAGSRFRPALARTAALAAARAGDLAQAARVLKQHYEPWLLQAGTPAQVAEHHLEISRFLYQAGSLEGAAAYYDRIPRGVPQFIVAQEEAAWIELRQGDRERVRGRVATLASPVFAGEFRPETYVIRAISSLKLCLYDEVRKDFTDFLEDNARWGKRIDAALESADPESPRRPDDFTRSAERQLAAADAQLVSARELERRSVGAPLPAVGQQRYWGEIIDALKSRSEKARKAVATERKRQWKADRIALQEAIRKMQFVKVELMTQMSRLAAQAAAAPAGGDAIGVSQAAATGAPAPAGPPQAALAPGAQVYEFDGVIWPDELFKLRSNAQGRCHGQ